ncbi:MAG: Holliday junction branch migration protein RuvA [Candidatus Gastranaerophilales bacterium]|nr:Holliday junction branch migration protein RuvA [Candidatus Gastranaerophilales bacterium]
MFEYIKGTLEEKYISNNSYYLVVDIGGIGYKTEVSELDYNSVSDSDTEIKIYTKLIHKEDLMSLCGFQKKETRDIFNYLVSVSGVGTKMALALLGRFDTCDLISIVINGEYKELTLAKGVGTKLAQKIILELRDKLIKANISSVSEKFAGTELSPACRETTSVLLSLGYSEDEINTAYKVVTERCKNKDDTEELLRETLKYLSM